MTEKNETLYRAQTIILKEEIKKRDARILELESKIRKFENTQILNSDIFNLHPEFKKDRRDLKLKEIEQLLHSFGKYLNFKDESKSIALLILNLEREFSNDKSIISILKFINNNMKWIIELNNAVHETKILNRKTQLITKRLLILCYRLFREINIVRDISGFLNSQVHQDFFGRFDSTPFLLQDWFQLCSNTLSDNDQSIETQDIATQTDFVYYSGSYIPTMNELLFKQLSEVIQELSAKQQ